MDEIIQAASGSGDPASIARLALHAEMWRQLERIFNGSDCVTLINSDYVYVAVNEVFCRAHGRNRDEIIGQTVAEIWGATVFEQRMRASLDRCLNGNHVTYRAAFAFPGDGTRHFDVSLHPYCARGEQFRDALVITRDVTAAQNAEEQARLMLVLAQTVNQAPDFDAALYQSLAKVCEFTGWTIAHVWCPAPDGERLGRARVPELDVVDLMASGAIPVRRERGEGLPGLVWESKKPVWLPEDALESSMPGAHTEYKAALAIPVIADGEVVAVIEFLLANPRAEDNRLMHVVSAIAEQLGSLFLRKRSQAALKKSETRYQMLIETANDVIFCLSPAGRMTEVNQAFTNLTGWERLKCLDDDFFAILHPDDVPSARERLARAIAGDPWPNSEYRIRKADGEFLIAEIALTPERSDGRLTGLFGVARDITDRKRTEEAVMQSEEHYRELFHQAFQMQEKLRQLSDHVLRVQEQERARISRDLHDEVGQSLTAIGVNLTVIENSSDWRSVEIAQRMADVRRLLEQTAVTVHQFSRDLRPAMLDDLGLIPALRSHIKEFTRRTGVKANLNVQRVEQIECVDSERKTVIYRIVQEGLNNIAKHAGASHVAVNATEQGNRIHLEIRDNGCGFAVDEAQPNDTARESLGLIGIAERVRLVHGEFLVDSQPGNGTTLRAVIPCNPSP